jgi:16S rRNA (uracil1498-N3)-methyltransferase
VVATPALFVVDQLPTGAGFVLDGPEGRHAATVRRLRVGEPLVLTDGRGGLAACRIAALGGHPGRDALRLDVVRCWHESAPAPRVVLAQALLKGDRGELAVELATEAGVDAVLPWRAARCVARWEPGARGERALRRWQATAREAAKQSRRAWLPEVGEPVNTAALAGRVAAVDRALVLHEHAVAGLASVKLPADGELLIVVGPEGGIDDAELDALTGAGAVAVRLGPTVLRASTAAAVTLGALGVLTGRWGPIHGKP